MAGFATKGRDASFLPQQDWLGLAAAPTFALMGGITAVTSPGVTICTTAASPWAPFGDMALMYLLMGLFHLPPWLRLLSTRSQRQNKGD